MNTLFSPLRLRDLDIPNRVWMAPMCTFSADADGDAMGVPTAFHTTHLVSRAVGGAGITMVEATAVRPEGRITPWDLGLWNDRQQEAFAPIAENIKSSGSVAAIQLAHAGRKASVNRPWESDASMPIPHSDGGWLPVGPSAVAYPGLQVPAELSTDEISSIVQSFADSARRALAAGFEIVEIHGAHGYLIHSFLSPFSNTRTDSYGGSFSNRIRFALEVVDAVRGVWPDSLPLFFRVSATDWLEENKDPRQGWNSDEAAMLAKELKNHGVDLVDVSTGGLVRDVKIPAGPNYQVPYSERIRTHSGIATGAVGLITSPQQAEAILLQEQADAVFLARELLRDPYWPRHAAKTLGAEENWPDQYGYAVKSGVSKIVGNR